MLVNINGKMVNTAHIVCAEIDTRSYVNGSVSYLVVSLDNGSTISVEHRAGSFDAFGTLDKIREVMK